MTERVLIYGMNYAPEMAGVGRYTGEIAEHLAAEGKRVTMITTPPHYPGWKVSPPYRNSYHCEQLNGVDVIRCPLLLRQPMRGIWRLVAPISFAVTSLPVVLWHFIRYRPAMVLCIEPTLIAAPVAVLAARLNGARSVLHVQDLEIDAAFAVGHLGGRTWLKRLGFAFERSVMRAFHRVITISNRMAGAIEGKGVESRKIKVIRNWVDLDSIFPSDGGVQYRCDLGYEHDDFIVLYSGNIGFKQDLYVLLDAAALLRSKTSIKFVIAGEGPLKLELMKRYADLDNVRFLPFQPMENLNSFLNMADLHALPQAANTADLVLPSKLGGMLASGRSIVVTADPDTEIFDFLGPAAFIAPPGDAVRLAELIGDVATHRLVADQGLQRQLALQLSRRDGLKRFAESLEFDQWS